MLKQSSLIQGFLAGDFANVSQVQIVLLDIQQLSVFGVCPNIRAPTSSNRLQCSPFVCAGFFGLVLKQILAGAGETCVWIVNQSLLGFVLHHPFQVFPGSFFLLGVSIDGKPLRTVGGCAGTIIIAWEGRVSPFTGGLGEIRVVHGAGEAHPGEGHGVKIVESGIKGLVHKPVGCSGIYRLILQHEAYEVLTGYDCFWGVDDTLSLPIFLIPYF